MKNLRNAKGFTLIELVVVIVILGILMMLVIPRVSEYQKGAQAATCRGNRRILASSQAAYYASERLYAANTGELLAANLIPSDMGCPSQGKNRAITDYDRSANDEFNWECNKNPDKAQPKYDHNTD